MPFCVICNVEIDGSNLYLCKYCGENYCPDHRLPPKHDCIGIEAWKSKVTPNGVQLARKEVLIVKPYIERFTDFDVEDPKDFPKDLLGAERDYAWRLDLVKEQTERLDTYYAIKSGRVVDMDEQQFREWLNDLYHQTKEFITRNRVAIYSGENYKSKIDGLTPESLLNIQKIYKKSIDLELERIKQNQKIIESDIKKSIDSYNQNVDYFNTKFLDKRFEQPPVIKMYPCKYCNQHFKSEEIFLCKFCLDNFCSEHKEPKAHVCKDYVDSAPVMEDVKNKSICDYCEKSVEATQLFKCDYCESNFCPEHILPPKHGCEEIGSWKARPSPDILGVKSSGSKFLSWLRKKKKF